MLSSGGGIFSFQPASHSDFDPNRDLVFIPYEQYNKPITEFDCDDSDLNNFILRKDEVGYFEKENLGKTMLVLCQKEENLPKVISYYTLSSSKISIEEKHYLHKGCKLKEFPTIKIGRLAVIKEFKRKGIGHYCLDKILLTIEPLSKTIGIRFIDVDAYNKPEIIKFYEDYGFVVSPLHKSNRHTVPMYLDLMRVKEAMYPASTRP